MQRMIRRLIQMNFCYLYFCGIRDHVWQIKMWNKPSDQITLSTTVYKQYIFKFLTDEFVRIFSSVLYISTHGEIITNILMCLILGFYHLKTFKCCMRAISFH